MSWREQVVGVIDRQAWLDRLGDVAVGWLRPVLSAREAGPVLDVLRGDEWLGHPLHPALVELPVGFWTASLLLDLTFAPRAAGLLTAAGSVAALGAAASGFADWQAREGRDRRMGVLHATLNAGALGLQLCSLGSRLRGRRRRAVAYSALGLSVATASGWLGGELAYSQPSDRET